MEQSGAEQLRQGEIANCALLRDNIVMLDYPSACWHRPASPWTHNPAEKQPSANGLFFFTLGCFLHNQCSRTSHWLELIYQVHFPVGFTTASPGRLASVVLLSFVLRCFPLCPNQHAVTVISAQHPQSRWAAIKILLSEPRIQWIMPLSVL